MLLALLILVGWLGHFVVCFYLIRPIRSILARTILTLVPCMVLTHIGCHGLPQLRMFSVYIIAIYWMVTIRLIHLTVISPDKFPTFSSFAFKVLWIFFQIVPCESTEEQWPVIFDFVSAGVKLILNHWIHRWLCTCESSESHARIVMFYVAMLTGSHILDVQIGLVRIITRDKYTLQSFNNFPLLSRSLREFWGRRYNRLTSTIFRESIFQPIHLCLSSWTIAALTTFIVSGLLHVHVVLIVWDDVSSIAPTFMFFLLHGIACCAEKNLANQMPEHVGWVVTHFFLFVTAPLFVGIFTQDGNKFFGLNPPPFIDVTWIPKLPVPTFCPK